MPAKKPIVMPGGAAGFGQQSVATQVLFNKAVGPARKKRRKKVAKKKRRVAKRRAAPTRRKKATRSRGKKPARLVKGSAAAKRHMAKLRRMRKS